MTCLQASWCWRMLEKEESVHAFKELLKCMKKKKAHPAPGAGCPLLMSFHKYLHQSSDWCTDWTAHWTAAW